jgi:hypothetical protein
MNIYQDVYVPIAPDQFKVLNFEEDNNVKLFSGTLIWWFDPKKKEYSWQPLKHSYWGFTYEAAAAKIGRQYGRSSSLVYFAIKREDFSSSKKDQKRIFTDLLLNAEIMSA